MSSIKGAFSSTSEKVCTDRIWEPEENVAAYLHWISSVISNTHGSNPSDGAGRDTGDGMGAGGGERRSRPLATLRSQDCSRFSAARSYRDHGPITKLQCIPAARGDPGHSLNWATLPTRGSDLIQKKPWSFSFAWISLTSSSWLVTI